ncbi:MAG TPA: hypothetical protein VED40_19655 [Azospirillaceae bacterium]|nr:hypothetical protein [Azospirillaceae bacterium]
MRRALFAFVMLSALATARSASACSCGYSGPADASVWANFGDAIFLALPLSADIPPDRWTPVRNRLQIVDSYKGGVTGEIVVETENPKGHSCGFSFTPGRGLRIVFADRHTDGRLTTHMCAGVVLRGVTLEEAKAKLAAWRDAGGKPYDLCAPPAKPGEDYAALRMYCKTP